MPRKGKVLDHTDYQPFGEIRELMRAKNSEVLLEGPAGTGKSRGALEKLHIAMENYPGARGLMCRKTRKSMTQSCMYTYETFVNPGVKLHQVTQEYRYPNGSKIIVAGLDDPTKIMSTEFDMAYVNEGTEISLEDFEMVKTRLRSPVMPYHQILIDCNPTYPTHWLNQRAGRGGMVRLKTSHEDNPTITKEYLESLNELTGARRDRLYLGLWVSAEGMVFSEWNEEECIVPRFRIPNSWKKYLVIDFGFTNPFVCQWWAVDNKTDIAYLYREIYHTQRTVEEHAHLIHALSQGEKFEIIITDHDAEDRATLERHISHNMDACFLQDYTPWNTIPALKDIESGVQSTKRKLKAKEIRIMEDCLVEEDRDLRKKGRPTSTKDEFAGYIWDKVDTKRLGEVAKEKPLKKDDHGMDCLRYFCIYLEQGSGRHFKAMFDEPAQLQFGPSSDKDLWKLFFEE